MNKIGPYLLRRGDMRRTGRSRTADAGCNKARMGVGGTTMRGGGGGVSDLASAGTGIAAHAAGSLNGMVETGAAAAGVWDPVDVDVAAGTVAAMTSATGELFCPAAVACVIGAAHASSSPAEGKLVGAAAGHTVDLAAGNSVEAAASKSMEAPPGNLAEAAAGTSAEAAAGTSTETAAGTSFEASAGN